MSANNANPDSLVTTNPTWSDSTIAHGTRGRPAKPEKGLETVPAPWDVVNPVKLVRSAFNGLRSAGQELMRQGEKYLEREAKKELKEFWKENEEDEPESDTDDQKKK